MLYSTVGDAAHVVTLLNAVAFLVVVGLYAGDKESSFLFDEAWKNDGFCVAGKAKSYWSSHDVCLYMDLALATGLAVLFLFLRNTAGLEAANKFIVPGVVGIVAHGIGHGAIARGMRDEDVIEKLQDNIQRPFSERLREESVSTILSEELPFIIFWIGLIYAAMPQSKKSVIFLVSLISHIGNRRIPIHLNFTFVQAVLFLCFSLNQISLPALDKNTFAYATHPLIVCIPTSMVAWIESTQCSSLVRDAFYGHVLYDGYIAASMIIWYFLCFVHTRGASSEAKKTV